MTRRFLENILFLVLYYFPILKKLKNKNISRINLFNFRNWHHGYAYFIGYHNEKKVFIKVDTSLHLLQNDKLVYDMCKNDIGEHLIKIINCSIDSKIQFIVYEFEFGNELNKEILIEKPKLIGDIYDILIFLYRHNIVHRDIKLDNFFVIDNKIKIIDFTFANSSKDNNKFKELDLSVKINCEILESLGIGLNPRVFEWNDFYSMKTILKKIIQEKNEQVDLNTKNTLENYIIKLEELETCNTYKIKCTNK